jgi:hypothetical protein
VVSDGLPREPVGEYVATEPWFTEFTLWCGQLESLSRECLPSFGELPETYDEMQDIVRLMDYLIRNSLAPAEQVAEMNDDEDDDQFGVDEDGGEADPDELALVEESESADSPEWEPWEEQRYGGGRLIIVEDQLLTILNGEHIPVGTQQQMLFLKAVADQRGNWISTKEIMREVPDLDGARCDRLRKRLDSRLQKIIKPKRGTGYQLRF